MISYYFGYVMKIYRYDDDVFEETQEDFIRINGKKYELYYSDNYFVFMKGGFCKYCFVISIKPNYKSFYVFYVDDYEDF